VNPATPNRVEPMSANATTGAKTPGTPQPGVRAPAGSGVTLRVGEGMLEALLDAILALFDLATELKRAGADRWQDGFQRAVEAMFEAMFGAKRSIYWDEYGVVVPAVVDGERAFIVLFNAGQWEGTYRIVFEGTDAYGEIAGSYRKYNLDATPLFEVSL